MRLIVFQWHSRLTLYKIDRRLPSGINVSLCFKVGAFLEELEYIFPSESPRNPGAGRGAEPSAYICTHNYRTTSQKWHTSAPWHGELEDVIVIIKVAAIVVLLLGRTHKEELIRNTRTPSINFPENRTSLIDRLKMLLDRNKYSICKIYRDILYICNDKVKLFLPRD